MRTVAVHRVRPCSSSPGSTWAAPAGWFERLSGSPGEPDPDGRSLATVVARDGQGPSPATTPAIGSDPYEMTGPLLAWGAAREAQPDAVLKPGAHGVVAALGLEALRGAEADVRGTAAEVVHHVVASLVTHRLPGG